MAKKYTLFLVKSHPLKKIQILKTMERRKIRQFFAHFASFAGNYHFTDYFSLTELAPEVSFFTFFGFPIYKTLLAPEVFASKRFDA
jgi:hypothetical protein